MNCLGMGGWGQEGGIVVEEAVCVKESWCGSCVGRGEGSWRGDLVEEIVCGKGLWGVSCVGKGGRGDWIWWNKLCVARDSGVGTVWEGGEGGREIWWRKLNMAKDSGA